MPTTTSPSSGALTRGVVISCIVLAGLLAASLFRHVGGVGGLSFAPQMVRSEIKTTGNRPLYVQKYELTVAQWNRCYDDGACSLHVKSRRYGSNDMIPATGLNWFDVQQYLVWINTKSGHKFRLPTKAEWTALAKDVLPKKPDPIFTDPDLTWASAYLVAPKRSRKIRPIGSFATTLDGIVDLNGNVWEWTSDCYSGSIKNVENSRCPAFYVGGEHLAAIPVFTRKPAQGGCAVGAPPAHLGLRLVTEKPMTNS